MAIVSRVRRHPFELDESNRDPYDEARRVRVGLRPRQWCRRCNLPGSPGDDRHTTLTYDEVLRAWREWDAARTGE